MDRPRARTIREDLAEVKRRIELLEQQLEAERAVCGQLEAELALSRVFPAGSGFTRN